MNHKSIIIKFCFFAIAISASCMSFAQEEAPGHRIEINIEGLPDTSFLLAYYFNESTYTSDTARSNSAGQVVFEGPDKLNRGVYILVLNDQKSKLFDFAVFDDQHFSLTTSTEDFYRNMKVKDDEQNELFFKNLLFNADQNAKAGPFSKILEDEAATEEEKKAAKEELSAINTFVEENQTKLIEDYPNSLVAKILSARQKFKFPENLKDPTEENQDGRYQYYKKNFWNNFDLTEDAMLRLPFPLLQNKLDEYFDKVVYQQPDSIISEIEHMASLTKPNPEMYKFVIWSLTSKYYAPQIMGLDQVFVHLSDTYFTSGEMDFWADEQLKENVTDRASKLRLSMIGMKAPNLIMQDQGERARSMHDIRSKYIILYFYDPDCGHCKTETPVLANFIKNTTFDAQVYSVCADTSMVKMKNYIVEMGMENWVNVNGPRSYTGGYQELYDAFQTPTLYVLNEEKEIIAKKLPADRLKDFLERYEEVQKGKLEDE